jgi:Rrf2 family protein
MTPVAAMFARKRYWTHDQLRLLGMLPDRDVARLTGRTWMAVRQKRALLGIPPAGGVPRRWWSAAEDNFVRRLPPAEAARRSGRTLRAVYARRFLLGKTARRPRKDGTAEREPLPPAWLFRNFGPAVRVLARLADEQPGTFVSSEVLAPVAGVPRKYVYELLLTLIRAGYLQSWIGLGGGYRLARPVDDVSLLEIAELVDGPVGGDVPKLVAGADPRIDRRLQAVCDAAAEIIRRNLGWVTVADLAARNGKGGKPRHPGPGN